MKDRHTVIVGSRLLGALVVYAALLMVPLIALSFMEWPKSLPLGPDAKPETRFLILAAIFGALGGSVRMITSLVWLIGNRRLTKSWVPWFLLQPFMGLVFGMLTYFLLRGGLIMDASSLNPFGVAILSGLAGIFSGQALLKLDTVFYSIFRHRPTHQADAADDAPRRR